MEIWTRTPIGLEKKMEYTDEEVASFVEQAEGWTSYIKDVIKYGEDTFDNGKWSGGEKVIEVPLKPEDYVVKDGKIFGFKPHDFMIWVEDEWMVNPVLHDDHLYKIEGIHNWQLLLEEENPYSHQTHKYYRQIKKPKKD